MQYQSLHPSMNINLIKNSVLNLQFSGIETPKTLSKSTTPLRVRSVNAFTKTLASGNKTSRDETPTRNIKPNAINKPPSRLITPFDRKVYTANKSLNGIMSPRTPKLNMTQSEMKLKATQLHQEYKIEDSSHTLPKPESTQYNNALLIPNELFNNKIALTIPASPETKKINNQCVVESSKFDSKNSPILNDDSIELPDENEIQANEPLKIIRKFLSTNSSFCMNTNTIDKENVNDAKIQVDSPSNNFLELKRTRTLPRTFGNIAVAEITLAQKPKISFLTPNRSRKTFSSLTECRVDDDTFKSENRNSNKSRQLTSSVNDEKKSKESEKDMLKFVSKVRAISTTKNKIIDNTTTKELAAFYRTQGSEFFSKKMENSELEKQIKLLMNRIKKLEEEEKTLGTRIVKEEQEYTKVKDQKIKNQNYKLDILRNKERENNELKRKKTQLIEEKTKLQSNLLAKVEKSQNSRKEKANDTRKILKLELEKLSNKQKDEIGKRVEKAKKGFEDDRKKKEIKTSREEELRLKTYQDFEQKMQEQSEKERLLKENLKDLSDKEMLLIEKKKCTLQIVAEIVKRKEKLLSAKVTIEKPLNFKQ